ncbi:MAG TPA: DUF1353 domain-containing protein [Phycisphaerales bacterium]|nr:DUF1353 domain-containing protein [Phycisphaerales bacterium]
MITNPELRSVWGFDRAAAQVITSDGHEIVLAAALTYTTKVGEYIEIPTGATSDGASIPRLLWRILPPFGKYWKAALLHDYLYRDTRRPKKECDLLLKEAAIACGVPAWKAQILYLGVALFGRLAFNNNRRKQK